MNGLEENLTDILNKCTTYPNYKVIVIFEKAIRRDEFLSEMKNVSNENSWSVSIGRRRIRFNNGSEIEAILRDSNIWQGRYANLVVLDECIIDKFEDVIFNNMTIPYDASQVRLNDDNQEDLITEFLNEFTVK